MQHHSMLLYIRHLRAHTAALAAESAARAEAAAAGGFQQELLLFSACPAEAPEQTPFHRLGEAAGDYSAALMSQVGSDPQRFCQDWLSMAFMCIMHSCASSSCASCLHVHICAPFP